MNTRALLIIIFGLTATTVSAFQNEPDGFRGIKWGANFSNYKHEMTLVEQDKDDKYYARKNDKMQIGAAEIKQIVYGFHEGKLTAVGIVTVGVSNKSNLIQTFQSQFGSGIKPNQFLDKYYWRGAVTTISLTCSSIREKCQTFMFSTKALERQAEEKRKAAEGAADDF